MLDELAVELRRVVHNLMPESLSHCGLKAALEDFCRSIPIADFRFFEEDTHLDK